MSNLPNIISALGVEKGDAADGMGISRQTLWRISEGKLEPTRPVIVGILDFLNRPEHLEKLGRPHPFTFEEIFSAAA